jgi:hypothetical protein
VIAAVPVPQEEELPGRGLLQVLVREAAGEDKLEDILAVGEVVEPV